MEKCIVQIEDEDQLLLADELFFSLLHLLCPKLLMNLDSLVVEQGELPEICEFFLA